MRIAAVRLAWFRGAATYVSLDADSKSLVVYGMNGSGKSSFVDGIEYAIRGGKINHLSHEYSGARQQKGVSNTHKPAGSLSEVQVDFQDKSALRIEIQDNGTFSRTGATTMMNTWDYRRTVLRQDEMAKFIHDTKGEKYSALLPLLGLSHLEFAAENLRQLARALEREAAFSEVRVTLRQAAALRKATLADAGDDTILSVIESLHRRYCPAKTATVDGLAQCDDIQSAVTTRLAASSADQRRYAALCDIAGFDIRGEVAAVQSASTKLGDTVEPLIEERLAVLEKAKAYLRGVPVTGEVVCPACGRAIATGDFQKHVKDEQERLKDIISVFEERKASMRTLSDTVKALKAAVVKPDAKPWYIEQSTGILIKQCACLDTTVAETLRETCGDADLKRLEDHLVPLIAAAASASKDAPPDAATLSGDKQTAEAAKAVLSSRPKAESLQRAEVVLDFVRALENGVRAEIRQRSQKVIDEITADIQTMWKELHPDHEIQNVSLYLPDDADKAIDIRLTFFGVEQDSPRLTLSEGYRNSLGLCIFLAMAKREAASDTPLFLDDVVVSLDREHRGMVAQLLETMFSKRQVILLTHDREWYTELRTLLDSKRWTCRALLPYESPQIGIRWSHKTTTFADARAQLKERPDAAGNDARKIMDVELAMLAERLESCLPYRRGEKNDKRTAHDFLGRLIADGKSMFKRKDGAAYVPHADAIALWENADRLLIAWGNRASHTFDVVGPEAAKLIDVCERSIEAFICPNCKKGVWVAVHANSRRCECGNLRWG